MRAFTVLTALVGAALAAPRPVATQRKDASGFTIARPGGIDDLTISKQNTLNGTYHTKTTEIVHHNKFANAVSGNLGLNLVNNLGDGVNAYVTGLDSDNKVVFLGPGNGTLVYPTSGGSTTPVNISDPIAIPLGAQGSTTNVNLPIALISGRIYFSVGELPFFIVSGDNGDSLVQPSVANPSDPSAGLSWGFVELTYTTDLEIYANISYVDFVGLILSMQLDNTDGTNQITKGLAGGSLDKICTDLRDQTNTDQLPWASMCIAAADGTALRALAPQDYSDTDGAFNNYWQPYVDSVWTQYTNTPLIINTQNGNGNVSCQVAGDTLNCDGDNRGYAKPVPADIWGCNSGPFGKQDGDNDIHLAVIPRLCAAFTRSTLLLDGGATQPSLPGTSYYTVSPTSHYSRIVHQYETDGKGYAFSYDDVNPDGNENASGEVHSSNPQSLTVFVGGYQGQ